MNTVNAIKDGEKLFEIQDTLQRDTSAHGRRMFLLFMMGTHTGLRISDLVRLRVKHVSGMEISTVEKKTGKLTVLPLDSVIRAVIQDRTRDMAANDYLFPSRNKSADGAAKHITTRTAYDDMQLIARRFNLGVCIGCHTLRKTFGYWHHKQNNNIELLRQWFNHASVEVTRRYIGMDVEEKRKSIIGFNPGGLRYEPEKPISRGRPRTASEPLESTNLDHTQQGRTVRRLCDSRRRSTAPRRKNKKCAHTSDYQQSLAFLTHGGTLLL